MARTIEEIQKDLLQAKYQAQELSALDILTADELDDVPDTSSKVSEWRLWIWIFATAIWTLEKLMDIFRAEVEERIANSRAHTKAWYREKALAFQFGYELNEKDYYDTIDPAAQIIKYASVQKVILTGRGALRMKIAKEEGDELAPLTDEELQAFSSYINQVADAGTYVFAESRPGDRINIDGIIYYDPQVLNTYGESYDGDLTVKDAIIAYFKSIDFDGKLIFSELLASIKQVPGVKGVKINKIAILTYGGEYITYEDQSGVIPEFIQPVSGWFIPDRLEFTFIDYES